MIVAIDVGTTKICVLIAQKIDHDQIEIIGIGKAPSQGLARGVVVDIVPAVHAIKAAIKEAEMMAGYQVESAAIGISGSHIKSLNSQGMISIRQGAIRASDVAHVLAVAQATPLAEGQKILHVLPQFFTIDGHHQVQDPVGMHAIRLEAQVHMITGALSSVQDLVHCCEMAGVKVQDIILEPLASAESVLSTDEKKLGVGILDIGGGTADLALYQNGAIRHTYVIPIAGNIFTNDIALCLRTTLRDAERIKRQFGAVHRSAVSKDGNIEVELAQGGELGFVEPLEVYEILESRVTELLMLVLRELKQHDLLPQMPAGLVMTGGGSLLQGMKERAQEILHMPVRIGKPRVPHVYHETLEHPMYATSYGLLLYALKQQQGAGDEIFSGSKVTQIFSRMKSWVFDFF